MIRNLLVIFSVLGILFAGNYSFAANDTDKCSRYKDYPSYYKRCQTMQERIKRMQKFKEKRREAQKKRRLTDSDRKPSKTDETKEKIEQAKKEAENNKEKIEEAIKKKAAELQKMEEEQKKAEEQDALPSEEKEEYTPIVVDPTQLTAEQIAKINSIIENKETNAEQKKPSTPQKPYQPTYKRVEVPDVGAGKKEYMKIEPITPEVLYGR